MACLSHALCGGDVFHVRTNLKNRVRKGFFLTDNNARRTNCRWFVITAFQGLVLRGARKSCYVVVSPIEMCYGRGSTNRLGLAALGKWHGAQQFEVFGPAG